MSVVFEIVRVPSKRLGMEYGTRGGERQIALEKGNEIVVDGWGARMGGSN